MNVSKPLCQTVFHSEWKHDEPTITDSVIDPLDDSDGWKHEKHLLIQGAEADVGGEEVVE